MRLNRPFAPSPGLTPAGFKLFRDFCNRHEQNRAQATAYFFSVSASNSCKYLPQMAGLEWVPWPVVKSVMGSRM